MDRCRRFIINKLGGVPREDDLKYRVEYVTYPTIKLAREYECSRDEETMIDRVKKEMSMEIGIRLLQANLLQFTYERNHINNNIKLRATIEVVDKRDKSI